MTSKTDQDKFDHLIKLIDASLKKEYKKGLSTYLKFEYDEPITRYCEKYNLDEKSFYKYFLDSI